MAINFDGAPQVRARWDRCAAAAPAPAPAGAAAVPSVVLDPRDEHAFVALREWTTDALRRLQLCGLSNECLARDTAEIEAAIAKQRGDVFKTIWLGEGLRAFQFAPEKAVWLLKDLPRDKCRAVLRAYLDPLLKPADFAFWLARLSADGARFGIFPERLVELPAVETDELLHPASLLALLSQDGRALDRALAEMRNAGTRPPRLDSFLLAGGPSPIGLYVVDFNDYIQAHLLLLYLQLYALVPASLRRGARTTVQQAIAFTYGIAALASVPVLTLYHGGHGSAVVEEIEPALSETTRSAHPLVEEMCDTLVSFVGSTIAEILRGLLSQLLILRERNGCELMRLATAATQTRQLMKPSLIPSGDVSVAFERADGTQQTLVIRPAITISSSDEEIYWVNSDLWPRFAGLGLLVNQAGVKLFVTAANNRWGGKHPPHSTHRSGKEIDLDWGYTIPSSDPKRRADRTVPNLAQQKKQDSKNGAYWDPRKNKAYDFVPVGPGPTTQIGYDALTTWVLLQAPAFYGFTRFLYGDTESMGAALAALKRAFPELDVPILYPKEGEKRGEPAHAALFEPSGHFNHLHIEGETTPPFETEANALRLDDAMLDRLYELALQRDVSPAFVAYFFGEQPDELSAESSNALFDAWMQRSEAGDPPLLPVWVD
jgi:hypothetical protein